MNMNNYRRYTNNSCIQYTTLLSTAINWEGYVQHSYRPNEEGKIDKLTNGKHKKKAIPLYATYALCCG
jgi:hypothetical protein